VHGERETRIATPTQVAPGSAAIRSLVASRAGVAITATGGHEAGVGRVDFLLVDLAEDPLTNVVDRKTVEYAKAPHQVAEAWESRVPLEVGRPHRVFFHVYDRTGVGLVAYDRCDFTCDSETHRKE
jgi:hypothetical protein